MYARLLQEEKAFTATVVMFAGSVKCVNFLQEEKVDPLRLAIDSESLTVSSCEQPLKAPAPSWVTLFGRTTVFSPVPENAEPPI